MIQGGETVTMSATVEYLSELKSLRKRHNVSQADIARELGSSRGKIAHIEAGRDIGKTPWMDWLEGILLYFKRTGNKQGAVEALEKLRRLIPEQDQEQLLKAFKQ